MKKLISILLALAVLISCVSMVTGLTVAADANSYTGEVWTPVEVQLTSSKQYTNAYAEIEMDVTLTHTDGTVITIPGFWYEGDTWAFRFSATKTGTWTYTVSCSDTANTGIHGQTGTIVVSEATSDTMAAQHGFVKIASDGRHFSYADGTPFFWLGDTNWQAPSTNSTTKCNYPGCDCGGQFQHIVSDRAAKGFTVYQTYFSATSMSATQGNESYWAGSQISGDGCENLIPNTSVWNNRIDFEFEYLAAHDMLAAVGFGCHTGTTKAMSLNSMKRLARYIVARYGCYNMAWISGQEINMASCRRAGTAWDEGMTACEVYTAVSAYVDSLDGYNHPNSAHQQGGADATDPAMAATGDEPWHDYFLVQGGHSNPMDKDFYESYYNFHTTKPYVEGELQYEEINCGPFTGYDKPRYGAWKALLSGTAGFTYGASGVWAASYSTSFYTGWLGGDSTYSYEPWYMGVDKQGSFEVGYMRKFFEALPDWTALVPQFYSGEYADFNEIENKVAAVTADKTTAVAYFYNAKSLSTGTFTNLIDDTSTLYNAFWFNPRTGKYIVAETDIYLENGVYAIPKKPTAEDWVFLLTTDDMDGIVTENIYAGDATEVSITGNKITPLSFKANGGVQYIGSTQRLSDNTRYLTDGKLNTVWEPFADRTTQFFNYDFGTAKAITNIVITPKAGTVIPDYRIYASNDGSDWTIILDTKLNGKKNMLDGSYVENLYGGWRYLRVMLMNPEAEGGEVTKEYETHYNSYMNCTYSHTAIAEMAVYGTGNATALGYALPYTPVYASDTQRKTAYAASIDFASAYGTTFHGTGYTTPFKDIPESAFGSNNYIDVKFAVYNNTASVLKTFALSNYWGRVCYLTETDAAQNKQFNGTFKTVDMAPGAMTTITLRVPKDAYYSNGSGRITTGENADGKGKLCNYKDVGLRIDFANPTTGAYEAPNGELIIACVNYACVNDLWDQLDWHDSTAVTAIESCEPEKFGNSFEFFHNELGHLPMFSGAVAPTCEAPGSTGIIICSLCGQTVQEATVIPAIGHNYVAASIDATCTTPGYVQYTCTNCQATYRSLEQELLPHSYVTIDKYEPTETAQGYSVFRCEVCGHIELGDFVDPVPAAETRYYAAKISPRNQNMITKYGFNNDGTHNNNMTVFHDLDFGTGDVCNVTFVVYNGTDKSLSNFTFAIMYGRYCYLSLGEDKDTLLDKFAYDQTVNIGAGQTKSITIPIPRDAYYVNQGSKLSEDNSGCGTAGRKLVNYSEVGIRYDFAGAPTTGDIYFMCTSDESVNRTFAATDYYLGGGAAKSVITDFNELPDSLKQVKSSMSVANNEMTFIDAEGGDSDMTMLFTDYGTTTISTEQAFAGTHSIKVVGGQYAYQSFAIKQIKNVIDGPGAYVVSGYMYIDTMPTNASNGSIITRLNARQKYGNRYNQSTQTFTLKASNVGKWVPFAITIDMPYDSWPTQEKDKPILDENDSNYYFKDLSSIALDNIGVGSVIYYDNIKVQKTEIIGTELVFNEGANAFKNVSSKITSLPDGKNTFTYRIYNVNDYEVEARAVFQAGDRNHDGQVIGWDYLNEGNPAFTKIAPHSFADVSYSFNVTDNCVTIPEKVNDEITTYQDPLTHLMTRIDIASDDSYKSIYPDGTTLIVTELSEQSSNLYGMGTKFYKHQDIYNLDTYVESGHSWATEVVAPTCTEQGYTLYYCTDEGCEKTFTTAYVPAAGHEYINATCTTPKHCANCDAVFAPALGHTFETYMDEPAGDNKYGYIVHHCLVCDEYVPEMVAREGGVNYAAKIVPSSSTVITAFGSDVITPFKEFEFEGDKAIVTFYVYNNTDRILNRVSISNKWGYNCYLTAQDAADKKPVDSNIKNTWIKPGEVATVQLTLPRDAYYSNTVGLIGDANSGNGVLCNYKDAAIRFDFCKNMPDWTAENNHMYESAVPTTGEVYFVSADDESINKNYAASARYSGIKGQEAITDVELLPEAIKYVANSNSVVSADRVFIDAEAADDASKFTTYGVAKVEKSQAQAFMGGSSIKLTGGTANYESMGFNAATTSKIITGGGKYNVSGWMYIEQMPAAKGMTLNLRTNSNNVYRICSAFTLQDAWVGKWVPFSTVFSVSDNDITEWTTSKAEDKALFDGDPASDKFWAKSITGLAFDAIGNGSVIYFDNLAIEKIDDTFYGALFTRTQEGSNGYYGRIEAKNITSLTPGAHTITYRFYNLNNDVVYAVAYFQDGWTSFKDINGKDVGRVKIDPGCYRDISWTFVVTENGKITVGSEEKDPTGLVLRLDIANKNNGYDSTGERVFVQELTTDEEVKGVLTADCSVSGTLSKNLTLNSTSREIKLIRNFVEHCDHNIVNDAAVAADCIHTGLTAGTHCSKCGKVFIAQEVIPATGVHNYVDTVVPPTAKDQGYTRHECTGCHDYYDDTFVDPLGGGNAIGDVNGDEKITAKDRMILSRYLDGWTGYDALCDLGAADIDGDGFVTANDRQILARYLAGWAEYASYFVTED